MVKETGTDPTDPYLDWAFFLQDRDKARTFEGEPWEPVLVQPLTDRFFAEAEEDGNILVDPYELELGKLLREYGGRLAPIFIYRVRGYARLDALYEVLLRGLPSEKSKGQAAYAVEAEPPLLAVIDDGLGFLNERFQRMEPGGMQTRVEAIWIQSVKQNPPPYGSFGGMIFGRELSKADIQARIGRPDERRAYKELNEPVFAADTVRTVEQAESHGSHIMDLAGGGDPYDPADPMRNVPVVGVQLPPQIVDDTSGMRMVPHIMQAMHWILLKAIQLGKSHIVVNLSFGVTAGPKDGTSLFSTHTEFLINVAQLFGIRLDVVVPFGNDFESRQVASVEAPVEEKVALDMHLPSDDRAPSYVEIRPEGDPADLGIGFEAPDGANISIQALPANTFRDIVHRGSVVGRVYHIPSVLGRDPYLMIAFAPTAPVLDDALPVNGQGPLVQAGLWQIVLANSGAQAVAVRLEIQRGDTMPGYRLRGRQAYFVDPHGYEYDMGDPPPTGVGNEMKTKDYTRLGVGAYVTYQGTNSAFTVVNGVGDQFHTVGGAFLRKIDPTVPLADQDEAVPSQYASYNTRPGRGDVTAGARSDHNRALTGLLASGVLSGSGARFSGSSAAAAVVSRHLVVPGSAGGFEDANAPGRLPEQVLRGSSEPRD
ncbi:MAG: hypothetical protein AAFY74_00040 [Pseudomonadota bacterium]